ncbi:FGGY-family carbohydrate kinase [Devosia ginsengisoli]|uniref:Carbohydrate kinase n=1 Tax=Devosia ginsengisoli TaxID=400770 RepID=A0A5B8LXT7_9HYPH|nr:FGGY family carbohydrate kinase [Devosia ginsengisoli]QDZ12621.1 carbohydrate kinase [Devosia ginsengisoli]
MSAEMAWLGIDIGTQSVRALVAAGDGTILASGQAPLASHREAGRHEQDPRQWWEAVGAACRQAMADIDRNRVAGLAVCGTSGTVLLADQQLRPLSAGIMYDDRRATGQVETVNDIGAALWRRMGYGRMQPVWALPKILWLTADAAPDALVFHQADFITSLMAGQRTAADTSNALKSGCDLVTEDWDGALIAALGLDPIVLPRLVRPGTEIGRVCMESAAHCGLRPGTPILAGMTDGCAAQLGSGAVTVGSWNSVLGTTLILKGTSPALIPDDSGAVYSHRSPLGEWLPGGASSSGAGAIARLLPGLDPDALEAAAAARPLPLPAYPLASERGERFPFTAAEAEAFFLEPAMQDDAVDGYHALAVGIAAMERLCFDHVEQLGFPTHGQIAVSGGAVRSRFLTQLRADMLGRELIVPGVAEPALGMAVLAAASQVGLHQAGASMVRRGKVVEPSPARQQQCFDRYGALVIALQQRGWLPARLAAHAKGKINR